MLAHFDGLHPDTIVGIGFHHLSDMHEDIAGNLLASHRRQDAQIHQPEARHALELDELRIVGGHQHGVIEDLVQPGAHFLEAAEVQAPVVLVERMRGEHEAEGEGIAVDLLAMRMAGPPLPEAAGQALVVAVGLGRAVQRYRCATAATRA